MKVIVDGKQIAFRFVKNFSCLSAPYSTVTLTDSEVSTKPIGWNDAKPYKSIPGPKPLPLVGNMWRFLPVIGEFYGADSMFINTRLHEKYGEIVLLSGLPFPDKVMLYNPDEIEHLFRNEGIYPIREAVGKSFAYYKEHVRADVYQGQHGIAEVHGEEWHRIRSITNPIVMQPRTVLQYAKDMDFIASQLIQKMQYLANLDPQKEMPDDFLVQVIYAWSLESMVLLCLDKHLGCLDPKLPKDSEPARIVEAATEMFQLFYKLERIPTTTQNLYESKTWKLFVERVDFITFTFKKYIDEVMKKIAANDDTAPREQTILQQLLKSDKKLALTVAMDFLSAGIDTTGKTAASCLYYLAKYPKAQSALREEMMRLLPTKDSSVTKEVLSQASYLKAVIKETTRIAPIAAGNLRDTVKDMIIGGYQIPKGTTVVPCNLILSLSESNYIKPKDFIPERWLRSTTGSLSSKSTHPFVTLPFGFGPRSCLGKRLANLELEIVIAKVVRNFYLEWHYEDPTFRATPFYGIVSPLKLRIHEVEK